ncbi:MAG: NADH-quinone oxidoreductase subunit N [Verrucomicrobia bacterium]|nr:NADH-quinone oxidoreductase subunit N [Verrucomicrobiota bacterium]
MSVAYAPIVRALGSETALVLVALAVLTLDFIIGRKREVAKRRELVGAVALFGLALSAVPLVGQVGMTNVLLPGETLVVNPLVIIFKFVLIVLTAVTVLISIDHDIGTHVGEYFAMLLFGAIGMLLLVGTEEFLTIFVALELTSISLYVLTAFHKNSLRSQEAALKYFLFGAIATAFLLFGLSYIYGLTGATNLRDIGAALAKKGTDPLLGVGLLCVLVGLGFKVAMVPFHLWAPDAYEGAPTPVTAFIATGSKVASFFVLVKVLMVAFAGAVGSAYWGAFESGWAMVLGLTATASMVLGNCAAIVQRNVKRLLAYSSIAHAGYILVGLVAASSTGATAVLFYVIVYAITNLGAFGVVAALASRAGGDDLEHFNGMAKRAPFLSLLMLVFVLSLAGIPPLGGFFGKFYLFAAAVECDAEMFGLLWLVALGIVMSAVSLYYYLVLMKHMYVLPAKDETRIATPGHLKMALAFCAAGVVLLGVFPEPILALLKALVVRL